MYETLVMRWLAKVKSEKLQRSGRDQKTLEGLKVETRRTASSAVKRIRLVAFRFWLVWMCGYFLETPGFQFLIIETNLTNLNNFTRDARKKHDMFALMHKTITSGRGSLFWFGDVFDIPCQKLHVKFEGWGGLTCYTFSG